MNIPYMKIFRDRQELFSFMTDEQLGRLIKCLLSVLNGVEAEPTDDIRLLFLSMKTELDRDEDAYIEKCTRNSSNGKRGGRPKANGYSENRTVSDETQKTERFLMKPKKANGFSENPKKRTVIQETQKSQEEEEEEEKEEEKEKEEEEEEEVVVGAASAEMLRDASTMNEVYDIAESMGIHGQMAALDALAADYSAEWVLEAIKRTSERSPDRWSIGYMKAILRSWSQDGGIDNPEKRIGEEEPYRPPVKWANE